MRKPNSHLIVRNTVSLHLYLYIRIFLEIANCCRQFDFSYGTLYMTDRMEILDVDADDVCQFDNDSWTENGQPAEIEEICFKELFMTEILMHSL